MPKTYRHTKVSTCFPHLLHQSFPSMQFLHVSLTFYTKVFLQCNLYAFHRFRVQQFLHVSLPFTPKFSFNAISTCFPYLLHQSFPSMLSPRVPQIQSSAVSTCFPYLLHQSFPSMLSPRVPQIQSSAVSTCFPHLLHQSFPTMQFLHVSLTFYTKVFLQCYLYAFHRFRVQQFLHPYLLHQSFPSMLSLRVPQIQSSAVSTCFPYLLHQSFPSVQFPRVPQIQSSAVSTCFPYLLHQSFPSMLSPRVPQIQSSAVAPGCLCSSSCNHQCQVVNHYIHYMNIHMTIFQYLHVYTLFRYNFKTTAPRGTDRSPEYNEHFCYKLYSRVKNLTTEWNEKQQHFITHASRSCYEFSLLL